MKLVGSHAIVGRPGGGAIFVTLASVFHAMMTSWLGRRNLPKIFKTSYEPLFFEPAQSFGGKIAQWPTQPTTSLQLLIMVLMLSVLAVAVVSMG